MFEAGYFFPAHHNLNVGILGYNNLYSAIEPVGYAMNRTDITLGGTVGFTNNGGVVINPGQWLPNAVGQLVQPIFSRGQLRANYKIAEAERKIALLQFNQSLINAGNEVNNALSDISAARERSVLIKEQIGLLSDAVTKTELLMRHSQTNYLEVLTAQQALLAVRQTEVQCRYDEIAGIITLYHALGGGR